MVRGLVEASVDLSLSTLILGRNEGPQGMFHKTVLRSAGPMNLPVYMWYSLFPKVPEELPLATAISASDESHHAAEKYDSIAEFNGDALVAAWLFGDVPFVEDVSAMYRCGYDGASLVKNLSFRHAIKNVPKSAPQLVQNHSKIMLKLCQDHSYANEMVQIRGIIICFPISNG